MTSPRVVRVAAVQASPAWLDRERSLSRLGEWARRAAKDGAQIIAFGETWIPGYPAWVDSSPDAALWGHAGGRAVFARLAQNAVEVPGPASEAIGSLARELGVTLVVGVHERAGRTIYNALLTFGPDGALANHHRKLMPTYAERLVWGLGDGAGLKAVATGAARVGGLVCWEHWMPLARQAMHDTGEEVHVAAWPGVQEMHQIASRHYAFEGRCFVVAVGSILRVADWPPELPPAEKYARDPSGLALKGGSAIIAPNGRYLAGPVYDAEAIVAADCDLDEITREAMTLDVSGHYSRPDVLELKVNGGRQHG
ncbi:MAG TPA: carbon-nitrogen hydrolase family protein [Gemmatimonadales bacterium]|nr:carbon-nitrogen hydrolase family protein [Gemmatimonadales bacterium]